MMPEYNFSVYMKYILFYAKSVQNHRGRAGDVKCLMGTSLRHYWERMEVYACVLKP